jgi:hypothetical protein
MFGIEGLFDNIFEYCQKTDFETSVRIVSTKCMSDRERQRWEEIKRNAVDVEFEEINYN